MTLVDRDSGFTRSSTTMSIPKRCRDWRHNKFDLFQIKSTDTNPRPRIYWRYANGIRSFYISSLALYPIQRVVTNVHTSVCVDDLAYFFFFKFSWLFSLLQHLSVYIHKEVSFLFGSRSGQHGIACLVSRVDSA